MEIEFEGDDLSLWMENVHMATGQLPEMGAFIPAKFSISEGMTFSDGSPIVIEKDTVALGIYEMDREIIALNIQEENFELAHEVRLIDTRYGLVMYIKWNLSPGRPQDSSAEHFLNMHSPDAIQAMKNMCGRDFFIVGYCDFHAQKVVRSCIMPSDAFRAIAVVATKAAEVVDKGQTYAEDVNPQKAFQEVMDHVDKNPPFVALLPEKTY